MYDCEFVFWRDEIEIRRGRLFFDDSRVIFEESDVKPKFIACPAFVNSHTHLGDSVAKDPPFSGIEVVMPGGYKFRMLEKYKQECEDAMRESIVYSALSGTLRIYDFREGGVEGVKALRRADKAGMCRILGRPKGESEEEAEEVIEVADGFGVSSVRDVGVEIASELRELSRKKGKLFFIHAGEIDERDVDEAIELEPDAIVHMNMAEERQLRRVFDLGIPVISCPRSNLFFGVFNPANYRMFLNYAEEGKWFLGTDNVMISSPSMLEEMHFASYLLRNDKAVFRAATSGIVSGLELGAVVFHRRMNFSRARNVLSTIVRRAGMEDVECVLPGEVVIK